MKKSLLLAASLAMIVTLAGCPGEENPSTPSSPNPSASPSPGESSVPTEPGQPGEPGKPTPTPTMVPTSNPGSQPSALPTLEPSGNQTVSLTSAQAVRNPQDFTYRFTVTGTGFTSIEDLAVLRFFSSDATIDLVRDGQARINVEIREVNVSENEISFVWLPQLGAPTQNDSVHFTYQRIGDDTVQRSSTLRLNVIHN
ncbi:MAG: hypothetical protein IGS03_10135 [Candidatus Sericytochromatia bacterium]|nr:hypothetical protein [Candidatus Sericytochromatia bacterium]